MFPKFYPKYLITIFTFLYFLIKLWFRKHTIIACYKYHLIKSVIKSSCSGGTTFIKITACFFAGGYFFYAMNSISPPSRVLFR